MPGGRLLIVEDDQQLCLILKKVLSVHGYEVDAVHDGRSGLNKIREAPYELLLVDMILPGVTGFDLCAEVKRTRPDLPIVVISGVVDPADGASDDALGFKADAFLAKPFAMNRLVQTIAGLLVQSDRPAAAALDPSDGAGTQGAARRSVSDADFLFEQVPEGVDAEPGQSGVGAGGWVAEISHRLLTLYGERASGTLSLSKGESGVEVDLLHGFPIEVRPPFRVDNLGTYLVRLGRVTQNAYADCLGAMIEAGSALEDALVRAGLIEPEELGPLRLAHQRDALIACFTWGAGEVRFAQRDIVVSEGHELQLNPGTLILEGVARAFPDRALRAEFEPMMDEPVEATPELDRALPLFGPVLFRTGLHMRLAGSPTVGELLREGGSEVLRLLKTFILLRTVRIAGWAEPIAVAGLAADPLATARRILRDILSKRGMDHYFALGVSREAPAEEIEEAFVEGVAALARLLAPDFVAPSDPEEPLRAAMLTLGRAYGVLSDPEVRTAYDARLAPLAPMETLIRPAEVHFQRGKSALDQGDLPAAAEAFRQACEADRTVAEYHMMHGMAIWKEDPQDPRRAQEAVRKILHAVDLDPENDMAFYYLGQIFGERGMPDRANQMYRRAVRLNAKNILARRALEAVEGGTVD